MIIFFCLDFSARALVSPLWTFINIRTAVFYGTTTAIAFIALAWVGSGLVGTSGKIVAVVYTTTTLVNVFAVSSVHRSISVTLIASTSVASLSVGARCICMALVFFEAFVQVSAKSAVSSKTIQTRTTETTDRIRAGSVDMAVVSPCSTFIDINTVETVALAAVSAATSVTTYKDCSQLQDLAYSPILFKQIASSLHWDV